MPVLKNCSIRFHTNDEDKDHDTHVTVNVFDSNNVVAAHVDNDFGKFGDNSTLEAAPKISLQFVPESGAEVDKTAGLEVRDYGKGNSFVFDQEAHWKFDLGTGNLPEDGKYRVSLVSGNEGEYRVDPRCTLVFLLSGGK